MTEDTPQVTLTEPTPQVVGAIDAEPLAILPDTKRLARDKLIHRLQVTSVRLARRQTGNLSRLGNLLRRVNGLRKQLGFPTLTLEQVRGFNPPPSAE